MALFLQNNKRSTRDKILHSALLLFVEKGFFNTSMPDLVKHSGVSNGSIYHHFKDKQQVAEALMEELIDYIEEQQQLILSKQQNGWQSYYQLVQWLLQATEQQPHLMQFVVKAQHQEFLPQSPPICSSQPFLNLRDVIAQGIKNGELVEMDVMLAAALAFGPVLRLIELRLDGLLEDSLNRYLEQITQTAWSSIANTTTQQTISHKL